MRVLRAILVLSLTWSALGGRAALAAPPDGTLAIGVHVTLVSRWLDPGDTEGLITPFMVLYALHDALVKPMPGGIMTPSLAESWTLAKDGVTYEFVLRKNAKFHNGDPVTAEDVKFTFERYKGSGAKQLKDRVREVQVVAPNRVRFVLREPWPDFMAFYGTWRPARAGSCRRSTSSAWARRPTRRLRWARGRSSSPRSPPAWSSRSTPSPTTGGRARR